MIVIYHNIYGDVSAVIYMVVYKTFETKYTWQAYLLFIVYLLSKIGTYRANIIFNFLYKSHLDRKRMSMNETWKATDDK